MKERKYKDDPYEEWGEARPTKPKLTKFRDEFSRKTRVRSIRDRWKDSKRPLAKKTLHDSPDSSALNLIRESNIPEDLLSSHSISMLESRFMREFQSVEITTEDLSRWSNGEEVAPLRRISKAISGRLFEEIMTREFAKRNPNYFITNPVLTSKIICPIIGRESSGELVMPDHLVFFKGAGVATLVGFMEDKKAIGLDEDNELFEQLEGEWSLFSLIADNDKTQAQFRCEAQIDIPSMPYRIGVASIDEGTIWLATAKGVGRYLGQMPKWVTLFESSVSGEAISQLAGSLINERFLPRLFPSSVKSADRD